MSTDNVYQIDNGSGYQIEDRDPQPAIPDAAASSNPLTAGNPEPFVQPAQTDIEAEAKVARATAGQGQKQTAKRRTGKVSAIKLVANRRNAQRSTGPKSQKGKEDVRANALKHGFFAKLTSLHPMGAEDRAESEDWRARMFAHYKPAEPLEEMVVDQLACHYYRLKKLTLYEEGVIQEKLFGAEHRARVAMGRHFSPVMSAKGPEFTDECLTASSRGVSYLLQVLAKMDTEVAEGCPTFDMSVLPNKLKNYLAPNSPVSDAALRLEHQENQGAFPRSPKKREALQRCRDDLRRAIAREKEALEIKRDQLLKEEGARREAIKAQCFIPDGGEARRMIRYHAHLARVIRRLVDQLEHLQELRRASTQAVSPLPGELVHQLSLPIHRLRAHNVLKRTAWHCH